MSKLTSSTALTEVPTPAPKYLVTPRAESRGSPRGGGAGRAAPAVTVGFVSAADVLPVFRDRGDALRLSDTLGLQLRRRRLHRLRPGRVHAGSGSRPDVDDVARPHLVVRPLHGDPARGVLVVGHAHQRGVLG